MEKSKKSEICFLRAHARSGTNWLCNLLNLHPDISCNGELHLEYLFKGFYNTVHADFGLMKRKPDVLRAKFYKLVEELVTEYCGGAPICIDRTPAYLRSTYMPNRKYLYISRDGRDIVVSWCYHALRLKILNIHEKQALFDKDPMYFEKNKHELLNREGYMRGLARNWNKQIVADLKFMDRVKSGELNMKYYWIRYEDLHAETDKYRTEIYEFLGADPDKAEPLTDITTAGFKRVNTKSHYRKGAVDGWKEYFTSEQLGWFNEEASEALDLLGLEKAT